VYDITLHLLGIELSVNQDIALYELWVVRIGPHHLCPDVKGD